MQIPTPKRKPLIMNPPIPDKKPKKNSPNEEKDKNLEEIKKFQKRAKAVYDFLKKRNLYGIMRETQKVREQNEIERGQI
ncbi:MAG: hypothetical protein AAF988_08410 [Pseudomonadota bacterium]